MKAWYFSNTDCRLRFDDNRKIKAGVTHKVDCKPVLCESGLHGSINILHGLNYAPGPYVWRVNLSGEIVRSSTNNSKCTATERTYLWGYDATQTLKKFARLCALDVAHLWDVPDVVIEYLKTGDDSRAKNIYPIAEKVAKNGDWSKLKINDIKAAWAASATLMAVNMNTTPTEKIAFNARGAASDAAFSVAVDELNQEIHTQISRFAWEVYNPYAVMTNDAWVGIRTAQSKRLYRIIMEERPRVAVLR